MKKKCNIVMIPTDKKSVLGGIGNSPLMMFDINKNGFVGVDFKHLYILSPDEEIKKDDIVLFPKTKDDKNNPNVIGQIISVAEYEVRIKVNNFDIPVPKSYCKKIIATTNSSLNLPLIPNTYLQEYIKDYNNGIIHSEVEVVYNSNYKLLQEGSLGFPEDDIYNWKVTLKINPIDNTIFISRTKENWTKEEVEQLINSFADFHKLNWLSQTTKDWIAKNL